MTPEELKKLGLKECELDSCGDQLYLLNRFDGFELIKKSGDDIQAVLRYLQDSEYWGMWVLLEWVSSYGDNFEHHEFSILAYGDGPGGDKSNLREPRHTYIGKNGYVFYINPDILTWGFEKLKQFYDFE